MALSTIGTNAITDATIATGDIADSAVTVAKTSGVGITSAAIFRLSTGFTGAGVITSNWEAADTDDSGSIGSIVSQSSGIFSFSATGIYLIHFQVGMYQDSDQRLLQIQIQSTPDNSTYDEAATGYTFLNDMADSSYSTAQTQFMFDCADTSNDKIRFYTGAASGTTNIGDTNANKTFASFVRLGDT